MKMQFVKLVTFLIIITPAVCQAIPLTFTIDGTIDGGTYDDVTIMSTATVGMTNGDISHMYVQNLGTLNFYNGNLGQADLWDSGEFNLEGGSFGNTLSLNNSSTFNLNSGTFNGLIYSYDYSHITIDGGQAPGIEFDMSSYAIADVFAGNVTIDSLDLRQYSVNNIYGGEVTFNCYPWIDDNSQLNIYGGDITFTQGFSLREDAEINVFYSGVIYNKPGGIIIGYNLLDNSNFMLDQFTYSEIGQINFVPEPTTLLLFAFGGLLLRKRS